MFSLQVNKTVTDDTALWLSLTLPLKTYYRVRLRLFINIPRHGLSVQCAEDIFLIISAINYRSILFIIIIIIDFAP
jgi:hypothetical protein